MQLRAKGLQNPLLGLQGLGLFGGEQVLVDQVLPAVAQLKSNTVASLPFGGAVEIEAWAFKPLR